MDNLDINNYTFSYKQLSSAPHSMMPVHWNVVIHNTGDNIKYSTNFQHPGYVPANDAVFAVFCNKETFKNNFWIELDNVTGKI